MFLYMLLAATGSPERWSRAIAWRFHAAPVGFWLMRPLEIAVLAGLSWLSDQSYAVVVVLAQTSTLDLTHATTSAQLGWLFAILGSLLLGMSLTFDVLVFAAVWIAGVLWKIPAVRRRAMLIVMSVNERLDTVFGGQSG